MSHWQTADEFGFDHLMASLPGDVVVMFGQPHCGACAGWYRQLPLWLQGLAAGYVYVDVAVATALARRFECFHLPALAVYRHGRFHGWLQSAFSQAAVRQAWQGCLAAPEAEEP